MNTHKLNPMKPPGSAHPTLREHQTMRMQAQCSHQLMAGQSTELNKGNLIDPSSLCIHQSGSLLISARLDLASISDSSSCLQWHKHRGDE
jgi:hypothetical protein